MEKGTANETGQTQELEIRCPAGTEVLPVLRTVVAALAGQVGFGEQEVDQIEMAVDEACANVIRHAYKHLGHSSDLPENKQCSDAQEKPACSLWLRICLGENFLQVCVIDSGIGIKDQPQGCENLHQFQEQGGSGGLGVYIIRNFMDEVDYKCPQESGTVLTMTKYLKVIREEKA